MSIFINNHFLIFTTTLFSLGVLGLLLKKNMISVLMSLELILNSAHINFACINKFYMHSNQLGYMWTIFIITISVVEAGIGIALIYQFFKLKNSVDINQASSIHH
ncbi:MAG: NADH-quinone oxidoreductase subunit NuoK [Alphaproteobacteria bacterium]|nr:NADH-quinone oxidoreductase subunit NuoK [Alphaproteobacteria bacterium]